MAVPVVPRMYSICADPAVAEIHTPLLVLSFLPPKNK
jgi:hypothetical protein